MESRNEIGSRRSYARGREEEAQYEAEARHGALERDVCDLVRGEVGSVAIVVLCSECGRPFSGRRAKAPLYRSHATSGPCRPAVGIEIQGKSALRRMEVCSLCI